VGGRQRKLKKKKNHKTTPGHYDDWGKTRKVETQSAFRIRQEVGTWGENSDQGLAPQKVEKPKGRTCSSRRKKEI